MISAQTQEGKKARKLVFLLKKMLQDYIVVEQAMETSREAAELTPFRFNWRACEPSNSTCTASSSLATATSAALAWMWKGASGSTEPPAPQATLSALFRSRARPWRSSLKA